MVIYKPKGPAGEYVDYAVNLYNGCHHGCRYCYAPGILHRTREDFQAIVSPKKDILKQIEKEAPSERRNGEAIFLSFTHDPYQPIEKDLQITRGAIEILKKAGNRLRILTKGGKLACRDFDLLDTNDFFGVTITDPSSIGYLEWEFYAASPEERIESLKEAYERGIQTWISLEPVLNPDHAYEVISMTHSFVDEYKVGKLNHHREIERGIDWQLFGEKVLSMLEGYGNRYYIKSDLKAYLAGKR